MSTRAALILCMILATSMGCMKDMHRGHMHCENLLTDTLGTHDSCRIYLPNAFTPNSDNGNDFYMPAAFNARSMTLEIFDQCDELIFSTMDINRGWYPAGNIRYNEPYFVRVQALTNQNHHIGLCGEFVALQCIPSGRQLEQYTFSDQFGYMGAMYHSNEVLMSCE